MTDTCFLFCRSFDTNLALDCSRANLYNRANRIFLLSITKSLHCVMVLMTSSTMRVIGVPHSQLYFLGKRKVHSEVACGLFADQDA